MLLDYDLLRAVSIENTDDLISDLKAFLENKLLFWIEAMNLTGSKSECSSLLKDAETWLEMVRAYIITSEQRYLNTYLCRERDALISWSNWKMQKISRISLQEAQHRNLHHIYTFQHCLCEIR